MVELCSKDIVSMFRGQGTPFGGQMMGSAPTTFAAAGEKKSKKKHKSKKTAGGRFSGGLLAHSTASSAAAAATEAQQQEERGATLEEIRRLIRDYRSVAEELVNTVDDRLGGSGNSCLEHACAKGESAIVALLLEAGARVCHGNDFGKSCLHISVERGHEECVQLLLDGGRRKTRDFRSGMDDKKPALTLGQLAAKRGSARMIRWLCDAGLSPNEQNCLGETPLHTAAHYNFPGCIEILLQYGANKEAMTTRGLGLSPLHYACQQASLEAAFALLHNGADPHALSSGAGSEMMGRQVDPVQLAMESGHLSFMRDFMKEIKLYREQREAVEQGKGAIREIKHRHVLEHTAILRRDLIRLRQTVASRGQAVNLSRQIERNHRVRGDLGITPELLEGEQEQEQ